MNLELKVIAVLVAILGLVGGYNLWASHERAIGAAPHIAEVARLNQAIADQKTEAAAKLAAETAKTKAKQDELNEAHTQQEKIDERNKQNTDGLVIRLHALATAHSGRLHDPYAAGCRCSGDRPKGADSAHANAGTTEPGLPGGLLSPELSRFLESKFEAAERLNDWYASCRADAQSVRINQN